MFNSLDSQQIQDFIQSGFIRIDEAFSTAIAEQVRSILWKEMKVDPDDSSTWTKSVIRLGMYTQEPFLRAANTPKLHQIFDQLAGVGQWLPCQQMGTFPIRFPSSEDPGDTGWHVDASFPGDTPHEYLSWRINVHSKGRALLLLFLFSDVTEQDAPTRIRIGSHLDVARVLEPAGAYGRSFMELAQTLDSLPNRPETLTVGPAGTVYACHPFLVHSAQPHRGHTPRFLAQPPLLRPPGWLPHSENPSPVEKAIQMALQEK